MNCGYRLHTQFKIFRGTVSRVDVTGSKPKGEADERALMANTVQPDRCYLMDRGSALFTLWNDIHAADSSYVCRVRDNSVYEIIDEKELTETDRKAGVISDQIVKFGGSKAEKAPDHVVRLVTVSTSEHTSRGNSAPGSSTGPSCDGKLRLATDLLDIPAKLIAEAYRLRWLIELLFPHVQTVIGLPSSAEHKAAWSRNPDGHGDYCVPVDSHSHGPRTDEAYVRNDLPLYVELAIAGRAGTAY